MQPERGECRGGGFRRAIGREGYRHRALAPFEEGFEPLGMFVALDDAQQLQVIAPEHEAVIGGALPQMSAARGQGEAEPDPAHPRAFEIAHRDDDVVQTRYAVAHLFLPPPARPNSWTSLREGAVRPPNDSRRAR